MEEQHSGPPRSETALEERLRELEAELAAVRLELQAAQEKQRLGDETFRRFSDSGVMGIALFDLSGQLAFANDALLKMVGYQAEELTAGRVGWEQLMPPEGIPRQALAMEELKSSGHCAPYECEYLRRDGTRSWGLFTGVRMTDDTAVAFLLDITERKQAEQALAAERERLRVTLASIGDAVIVTDERGQPTFLNPIAETLTGWTQAAASGKPLDEVFHIINEETRQLAVSPVERVLREGMVVGLANHTVLIARDGTECAIDDSAAPIPDEAGRTTGVVLVFRDVTERRRAEEALQASEREFRSIFELAGSGKAQADPVTGRFTRVNRRFCEMVGYTEAELLELTPAEITHLDDRERERARIDALLLGQQDEWQSEQRYVRKDGAVVWVMVTSRLIRDDAGRPLRTISTLHDMTDRKAIEDALREADRRKDQFLAMLAHELRNPLGAISTAVHVLQQPHASEAARQRALQVLRRQVQHQSRMVNELLDVSRITRGLIELHPEPFDLTRLVSDAADDYRVAFEQERIEFHLELPERPLPVMADATRLAQVVSNLLSNALKFTPSGGRVTVRAEAGADGRGAVVIVRDTGIGIEPELLPFVFGSFSQGDRTLARSRGGLGLGLAIVKGLVELHGGTVSADSVGQGQGTTVRVTLPLDQAVAEAPRESSAAPTAAHPLRVLVVEDNRDAAEMLKDILEMNGYEVEIALTGPEGVRAARSYHPDVVLCDIGLPGMDGYEVAAALRSDPGGAPQRLVAVTGYGQDEDRRRSREAGFQYHLVKPIDPEELREVLMTMADDMAG